MEIVVAVAHVPWIEERVENLAVIRERCAPMEVIVAEDALPPDNAGCWPTTKRAMQAGLATGAEAVLVLHDDAIPCEVNFAPALARMRALLPEEVLGLFFMAPSAARAAWEAGSSWLRAPGWVYGLANLYPAHLLAEFLVWVEQEIPEDYDVNVDDRRVGAWLTETGRSAWYPVPNLVEHPEMRSSLGHTMRPGGRPRVSPDWMGAQDPMTFDWTLGLDDPPVHRAGTPPKFISGARRLREERSR